LPGQRERLQELLARRQVIMGNGGGFSERLAYLENRKANALSHVSNIKARVTAPVGGYFCSIIDGYENLLTIRDFTTLSVDDYRRAAGGLMEPTPTGNAIGRVQIGHNWYLAALVDDGISNRFTPGGSVSLDFGVADSREIPVRIAQVLRDPASASGQAVVILQCNRINPHLISLRRATVDIRFASYTGLRINPAAIRFDGETEGVYVLEGRRIAFKKIERIYETENYVLCKIVMPSASEPIAPLKLFDEVIVEGVDLYDGKIV
ncbi:MAG: HlyD family efflux transporter periplasmic adaptor subunit, partial [Oscillospiraceae bacterium]